MHAIDGMACAKRGCDNRGYFRHQVLVKRVVLQLWPAATGSLKR